MKLLIILLFFGNAALAQADSLQQQINEQVWKPFIKSYNSYDTEGYMAVHSKELTRVVQDAGRVMGYDEYRAAFASGNKNDKRVIELRFTQRIAAAGKAFDVGYYKLVMEKNTFYGKFHVLLRKEDGKWKIIMDADEKTTEAMFQSAKGLHTNRP